MKNLNQHPNQQEGVVKRTLYIIAIIVGLTMSLSTAGNTLAGQAAPSSSTGGMAQGPSIEVVAPVAGQALITPCEVFIKFTPHTKPVDLSTLEVTLVMLFSFDITDLVLPYVTAEGIRASGLGIPSGKHTVRISIADVDGHATVQELQLVGDRAFLLGCAAPTPSRSPKGARSDRGLNS